MASKVIASCKETGVRWEEKRSFKQITLKHSEEYIRSLGQAQLSAPLPSPASFDFGAPVLRVHPSGNMGVKL